MNCAIVLRENKYRRFVEGAFAETGQRYWVVPFGDIEAVLKDLNQIDFLVTDDVELANAAFLREGIEGVLVAGSTRSGIYYETAIVYVPQQEEKLVHCILNGTMVRTPVFAVDLDQEIGVLEEKLKLLRRRREAVGLVVARHSVSVDSSASATQSS